MVRSSRALQFASLAVLCACSSNNSTPSTDAGYAGVTPDGSGGVAEASEGGGGPRNPDTTPIASVDRFSDAFAHLFKRSANPSFPAPNAPINCDQGPFITHGLGPNGEKVAYYNFDVLPTTPAPIYVLFSGNAQVQGQLNIIDVLPGDPGYNDFWEIVKVTVPANYIANSVTSLAEIRAAGFATTATNMLVNCPVVPAGSTATLRYTSESSSLQRGWYRDQVVQYFSFDERALAATSAGTVPVAPILVAFNVDPSSTNPMSGPPSGFVTEPGSMQTHNVISTLPTDSAYSPLWAVSAYKSTSFSAVSNWKTAIQAPVAASGLGDVNCPVVAVEAADGGTSAGEGGPDGSADSTAD
jgi:hypothetical protein